MNATLHEGTEIMLSGTEPDEGKRPSSSPEGLHRAHAAVRKCTPCLGKSASLHLEQPNVSHLVSSRAPLPHQRPKQRARTLARPNQRAPHMHTLMQLRSAHGAHLSVGGLSHI
eukprot:XP_001697402.1 predicted protein [Chlamydomonas reinhardtii]